MLTSSSITNFLYKSTVHAKPVYTGPTPVEKTDFYPNNLHHWLIHTILSKKYKEMLLKKHLRHIVCFLHYRDKSSTSNMKIDTLAFLGCILAQHPPKVFHPHIHVLVPVSMKFLPFLFCFKVSKWVFHMIYLMFIAPNWPKKCLLQSSPINSSLSRCLY